ncbi:non-heme iron oxygenase ferredoxin subunit [Sphingomonas colocasiae]|nr:non-heme iron oxygenase ferredoxin subunit [Sphingomonas colocasiae]
MDLVRIGKADDLQEGEIRRVSVPGYEPLALCRSGGRLHLFADMCSHGMASLSEGEVADGQVFCPFHGGGFDVATGMPTERPCTIPINVYALVERDGDVLVAGKM